MKQNRLSICVLIGACFLLAGCQETQDTAANSPAVTPQDQTAEQTTPPGGQPASDSAEATQTSEMEGGQAMAFTLTSPVFDNGEAIPAKYTGDGQDISPPLNWSGVPEGTKRFALICDDPDAPAGTWVHWVIWNVPPDQSGLDEAVPTDPQLANGARQGMNDFQSIGYGGPAPPKGPAHRYYFKLYALDTELALQPGASKQQLLDGMEGSILAEAQLMGTYQR